MYLLVDIPGVDKLKFEDVENVEEKLKDLCIPCSKWICSTNGGIISARAKFPLLGGKGGFGANLKAAGGKSKGKSVGSIDLQRDLTTGERVKDLKKLKKLNNAIQNCQDEERLRLQAKREKLERAIAYYEKKLAPNEKFDDVEWEQEAEKLMDDLQETLSVAFESEDEDESESEDEDQDESSESEDVKNKSKEDNDENKKSKDLKDGHEVSIENKKAPKFASFFD
ncbi:hypothetical protein CAAN3_10S03444 [[Candida] anglica]